MEARGTHRTAAGTPPPYQATREREEGGRRGGRGRLLRPLNLRSQVRPVPFLSSWGAFGPTFTRRAPKPAPSPDPFLLSGPDLQDVGWRGVSGPAGGRSGGKQGTVAAGGGPLLQDAPSVPLGHPLLPSGSPAGPASHPRGRHTSQPTLTRPGPRRDSPGPRRASFPERPRPWDPQGQRSKPKLQIPANLGKPAHVYLAKAGRKSGRKAKLCWMGSGRRLHTFA